MHIDGELYQLGIVVRDLDAAMDHYRRVLGVGPFWRLDTDYLARYRDWTGRVANRNAFAKWGNIYLELIEPGIGHTNAREWLDAKGDGIFHLGYAVDDVTALPEGASVCFESLNADAPESPPMVVHLDTAEELGYFLELADRRMVDKLNATIDAFAASAAAEPQSS